MRARSPALTLVLVLGTAVPALAAPAAAATPSIHVGSIEKLRPLNSFLTRAGQHSASLRPEVFWSRVHPFFALAPGEPEVVSALGIQSNGPVLSVEGGERPAACLTVANAERFADAARNSLQREGQVREATRSGARVWIAEAAGNMTGATALKGKVACSAIGPRADLLATQALTASVAGVDAKVRGKAADGVFKDRTGTVAFRSDGDSLFLEGTSTRLPTLPSLQTSGKIPFSLPKVDVGLMSARALLDGRGITRAVDELVGQLATLCATCEMNAAFASVRPALTGAALVHVSQARPRAGLRTPSDKYLAVRHALLLALKQPGAAATLLEKAKAWPGAKTTAEGVMLPLSGGALSVGVRGGVLYLSNDEAALSHAFTGMGASSLAHGADFAVNAPGLAKTLTSVSVLDVIAEPNLAAFLAVAVEFGPVLSRTGELSGYVDPAGGKAGPKVSAQWTLPRI